MKVKCERSALLDAFGIALSVVPVRTTIPAVMSVRLAASKGSLEVVATDLEYGIRLSLIAETGQDGTIVMPAARMGAILREVTDEHITIESDDRVAFIKTADASFKVVCGAPEDFPAIPSFDEKGSIKVATDDLGEMVKKTQFAASGEPVRYALTGQLLELRSRELRMVSSDGKRLAFVRSRASSKDAAKDLRVIVPVKTLNLLDKVLTDADESILVQIEESQVKFRSSRAMVFSRIIDGNFPDYEAVIPKDSDKKAVIVREAFLGAVRKVALVTTDRTRAVKLTFTKNKLTLFARTSDVGEASVEIAADYTGEEIDPVLNPEFIMDYLKAATEQQIELHMKNRVSACVFKAGKDYTYVLMPLTVTI